MGAISTTDFKAYTKPEVDENEVKNTNDSEG